MAKQKRVYMDYASATPLAPGVARAFARALNTFGNPSSMHAEGRAARTALDSARERIAATLSVKPDELVFTSGGTESNALAILGVKVAHIITSTIEHGSVAGPVAQAERRGARVTRLRPRADGIVEPAAIKAALRDEPTLVTLAHVNSECGVVQPIKDIVRLLHDTAILHVDAAQSPMWLDASPNALGASLVSYDAQKVGGPKGVGMLYRDFAVALTPLVGGGTQERGVRPGTENVPAIIASVPAFEWAHKGRKARAQKVASLRDFLYTEIQRLAPTVIVVGSMKHRVANNLFIAVPGRDGDFLTVQLDTLGIAVSPRSACSGSGGGTSSVAEELGVPGGSIRLTLGPSTTKAECLAAARALASLL